MTARICLDCPTVVSRQSRSGRCHPCAMKAKHADPAYRAALRAGHAAHFAQPEAKRAAGDRLRTYMQNMPAADRERRREDGRRLVHVRFTPEAVARSRTPDAIARRSKSYSDTRLGWCPDHLRPQYIELVSAKRIPRVEARRIIEAEIPGTAEHARRVVANNQLVARLRHERQIAEAY